jgi:peptidyl-prolyl cis-trans isomerase SurA
VPEAGDTVLALHRLALPFAPNAGPAQVNRALAAAQAASQEVRGCAALRERAAQLGVGDGVDMGRGRLSDLPPPVRQLVENLPVGQPTAPQRAPDGVLVFMVCEREAPEATTASRDEIAESLGQSRIDMLQRRYLRDLRSGAYVDVRM